ncbi:MAG: TPM domain-containing protein [Candidatus Omnitrophica bacterium]|nr:TPM domain-containing protein [Candidatus Omnitrophota bacterium]
MVMPWEKNRSRSAVVKSTPKILVAKTFAAKLFIARLFIAKLFIICLLLTAAAAQAAKTPWPKPEAYVSDFAGVISGREEALLNQLAATLEKKTNVQLAIVAIESLQDRGFGTIEEAAVDLFEQWGIGQKETNEGLLILTALKERKWRVEVGYGLEGVIPDVIASRLGRTLLVDAFRAGRYGQGLYDLSIALTARIAEERNIPLSEFQLDAAAVQRAEQARSKAGRGGSAGGILPIIFGIVMFIFFIKNPKLFLLYMLFGGGRHNSRWGGGSHFGGGFGGGSSFGGGGFGGFGGGMSGGGGASGGW